MIFLQHGEHYKLRPAVVCTEQSEHVKREISGKFQLTTKEAAAAIAAKKDSMRSMGIIIRLSSKCDLDSEFSCALSLP